MPDQEVDNDHVVELTWGDMSIPCATCNPEMLTIVFSNISIQVLINLPSVKHHESLTSVVVSF